MAYRSRFRRFRRRALGRGRRSRGGRVAFSRRVRRISYGIAERKYCDYSMGADAIAYYPPLGSNPGSAEAKVSNQWKFLNLLGNITQGVGQGQRIGNKIFVRYIQLNLNFQYDEASAGMGVNGCRCRYVAAIDRQHGSLATIGNGFFVTGSSTAPLVDLNVNAFRSSNTLGKFKTLLDKQHVLSYTGSAFASGVATVQHYIPIFREFQMTYEDSVTPTSAANFPKNALFFGSCSNHTAMCGLTIDVRVCFTDA